MELVFKMEKILRDNYLHFSRSDTSIRELSEALAQAAIIHHNREIEKFSLSLGAQDHEIKALTKERDQAREERDELKQQLYRRTIERDEAAARVKNLELVFIEERDELKEEFSTTIHQRDDFKREMLRLESLIEERDRANAANCSHTKPSPESKINHPAHYNQHPSGVECIDIVEHFNFNLGNTVKYVWRCGLKEDEIEDLRKAGWYIEREIQKREKAKR